MAAISASWDFVQLEDYQLITGVIHVIRGLIDAKLSKTYSGIQMPTYVSPACGNLS